MLLKALPFHYDTGGHQNTVEGFSTSASNTTTNTSLQGSYMQDLPMETKNTVKLGNVGDTGASVVVFRQKPNSAANSEKKLDLQKTH